MALAASAWVTTDQELKLLVAAAVVDGVDATDALVVGAAIDELEEDEPHAASTMAAGTATTDPTTPRRILIRPLDRIGGRCVRRSVFHWDPLCRLSHF